MPRHLGTRMPSMEISEDLATALHDLVRASDAARASPSDRQAIRRAVEQTQLVVQLARGEGFGDSDTGEVG